MDTEIVCLGIIAVEKATGYDIRKFVEEGPFSHFYAAEYGSIYPALKRLLDKGFISCDLIEQEGKPSKKLYSITSEGKIHLIQQLAQSDPKKDKVRSDFCFILFFAELLASDHIDDLIDNRLSHYDEKIKKMEEDDLSDAPQGAKFVHGLGLAIYKAAANYIQENATKLNE